MSDELVNLNVPESRRLVWRLARRFDAIQDFYERRKNNRRRAVLRAVIPADGRGAELGVHKGHLTPVLFRELRPKHMYVVDPWYLLGPEWKWAAGNRSTVAGLARVVKHLRPWLENQTATLVVADDREFLAGLEDGALDWAYIDTSHEYAHTVDELSLLQRKIRAGGVVAGDDWQSDVRHRHHGVAKAVREFVEREGAELILADDLTHQWAIQI